MASPGVERMLGGSPMAVLGRLILLSILVGVVLQVLGFDPMNILASVKALARHIYAMGFDAVRLVWRYLLLGAVVVVPIWIVMRLLNRGQ
jgi:hypothetical protein